jgi:hypothetical protein
MGLPHLKHTPELAACLYERIWAWDFNPRTPRVELGRMHPSYVLFGRWEVGDQARGTWCRGQIQISYPPRSFADRNFWTWSLECMGACHSFQRPKIRSLE